MEAGRKISEKQTDGQSSRHTDSGDRGADM